MQRKIAVAIILARGGSKGVPGKNLALVGKKSLLARSVAAAHDAPSICSVWVSTDDAAIASEARECGAEVILRPEALSNDIASSEDGWLHALSEIKARGTAPDRLVLLQCTSPFTTGSDIEACLAEMDRAKAASVLSVMEDHSFLWTATESGHATGINHNAHEPRKRRQDLPPSFRESGAIYVVGADAFEKERNRFCKPVAICQVDHPALEIDNHIDLEIARSFERSRKSNGPNQLGSIRALVMDFDGVHTDDLVHTTQDGAEVVVTSRSDGMGLSALRNSGRCDMLILSKERNPVVLARADKLRIEALNAVDDKVAALDSWLEARGLSWTETAFIGNDINDLPVLRKSGVSICPSDAHESVLSTVDWILPKPGGRGALRHLCDTLLEAQR